MEIEIKIPSVGESVQEAVLVEWYKKDGDEVQKDEPLFVIETDKVTLEIVAEASGILKILIREGETVSIGAVVGSIDVKEVSEAEPESAAPEEEPEKEVSEAEPEAAPQEKEPEEKMERPQAVPKKPETSVASKAASEELTAEKKPADGPKILSPSVRRLVSEKNIDIADIIGTGPGGRVTKGDVLLYLEQASSDASMKPASHVDVEKVADSKSEIPEKTVTDDDEDVTRKPMTPMRRRIASRLLEAKHSTAMLTTFNEIDMSAVVELRQRRRDSFKERHGVKLGFMSFFVKASVGALKQFPRLNAEIDGEEIVLKHYYDIGMAIGAEDGLVVPVLRDVERMSFAEIEQAILEYADKAKEGSLMLEDLRGGTFTITNGGVFGSLLSTPIINPPQVAILGLHKIEKRPVVSDDEIVIRPMMYVALSYDHRIVDGREAVQFLVRIKELIEDPEALLLEG